MASSTPAVRRVVSTLFARSNAASNGASANGNAAYLSQQCIADFFTTLSTVLPGFDQTTAIQRPLDSETSPRVLEVSIALPAESKLESLRKNADVAAFEQKWTVEAVFQNDDVYRRHKRLAVFDMDSTLIQQEVIDEVARHIGVEDKVSAITEAAMNGELDFKQSLEKRCELLKGVPVSVWENIRKLITPTPGAVELIKALKRLGYKTAVLSGGFTPVTGWFAEQLGLDYAHANHLVVENETLTGVLTGEIVDAQCKAKHVKRIAEKEGIKLEQAFCVGDGANDLPMMGVAGLGVAFRAKPKVQLQAPTRINSETLLDVLYLLGISKAEREQLLQ
ncbi:HAD-like domain-containing protein [Phyllosticta capitalensis]